MKPSDRQVGGDHYKDYLISPVQFIYENEVPFLEASALKYILRHRKKGGAEDIRKAIHYLELILEYEYEPQESLSEKSPGIAEEEPHRQGLAVPSV